MGYCNLLRSCKTQRHFSDHSMEPRSHQISVEWILSTFNSNAFNKISVDICAQRTPTVLDSGNCIGIFNSGSTDWTQIMHTTNSWTPHMSNSIFYLGFPNSENDSVLCGTRHAPNSKCEIQLSEKTGLCSTEPYIWTLAALVANRTPITGVLSICSFN